jgi:hypothetical protein
VAAGGRQQADQVKVDVGETAVRNWYLCWLLVDMLVNLPRWQNKHALAMSVMALAIWGQQKWAVMRRRVDRTPGLMEGV